MPPFTLPRLIYEGEGSLEEFVNSLQQDKMQKIFIVTDET